MAQLRTTKMNKMVYLAGPISTCTDSEAKGWREKAAQNLNSHGISIVDPFRRDFRGREQKEFNQIIESDKKDIDSCTILLAFCWKPSVGTSMEILYAQMNGLTVVSIGENLSPWILYHSTKVFPTLSKGLEYLVKL